MRIQTMNKRLVQIEDELNDICGEFKLKLENYIRKNHPSRVDVIVDYNEVMIHTGLIFSLELLNDIEREFLLDLSLCEMTNNADGDTVDLNYIFVHKKMV